MNVDLTTILAVNGLVVVTTTVTFVLNTVLHRNDAVGRIWSVAYVSGILAAFCYLVWGLAPEDSRWAIAAGDGASVLSIAMMWCGARAYNGRRALQPVAYVLTVLTTAAVLVRVLSGGLWFGGAELCFALIVVSALMALECARGRLRRLVSARVLVIVFSGFAAFNVVRVVILVAHGPDSGASRTYVGTTTAILIDIALVIVAAISMSVLQSQPESADGEVSRSSFRVPGVLGRTLFAELATDWLQRSRSDRDPLVLVLFEIDNLTHITTAYGRSMGDRTVVAVGRTACTVCPPSTIVGRSEGQRFFILTTAPSFGSPQAIAERIQTALVEAPLDALEGIRATASWGVATTAAEGYDLEPLMHAAETALAGSSRSGSGTITLADSSA